MFITNNHGGIFFLILAIFIGTINDLISKMVDQRSNSIKTIFFRALFGLLVLSPFILSTEYKNSVI